MSNEPALADHLRTTARTFDPAHLAAVPALGRVAFETRDRRWFAETIGGNLMAFYDKGHLTHVWNCKTGQEYRPKTDEQREQAERLASMSQGELAHYFADREPFGPSSKVYFIGHKEHAIKIGVTADLDQRFRAIQACSPVKLEIFATRPGGEAREIAYHTQFSEHRLHGEWFTPHAEILVEIDRLSGENQPPAALFRRVGRA